MLLMSSVPWIPAGLLSGTEAQKELPEKQSLRQTGGRTLASPLPSPPISHSCLPLAGTAWRVVPDVVVSRAECKKIWEQRGSLLA